MLLLEMRIPELLALSWLLSILVWFIALILLISGLVTIRSNPESGKKLLSISGIIFLVGLGICGVGAIGTQLLSHN